MATERAGRSLFETCSHSRLILEFWAVDGGRFEDQGKSVARIESGALRKIKSVSEQLDTVGD